MQIARAPETCADRYEYVYTFAEKASARPTDDITSVIANARREDG